MTIIAQKISRFLRPYQKVPTTKSSSHDHSLDVCVPIIGNEDVSAPTTEDQQKSNDEQEEGPRCWCCWLTKSDPVTTDQNPLIRACTGCKDEDLQYVHRDCMNRYITNLIQIRQPYENVSQVPYIPYEAVKDILGGSQGKKLPAFRHHAPSCRQYNKNTTTMTTTTMTTTTTSANANANANATNRKAGLFERQCRCPRYDRLDGLELKCTRCTDPYNVVARPISAFQVLLSDRVLRVLVGLMSLCMLILVSASSLLIWAPHRMDDGRPALTIRTWWSASPMDIRLWAGILMGAFVAIYAITIAVVLYHCAGFREILVLAKDFPMPVSDDDIHDHDHDHDHSGCLEEPEGEMLV